MGSSQHPFTRYDENYSVVFIHLTIFPISVIKPQQGKTISE